MISCRNFQRSFWSSSLLCILNHELWNEETIIQSEVLISCLEACTEPESLTNHLQMFGEPLQTAWIGKLRQLCSLHFQPVAVPGLEHLIEITRTQWRVVTYTVRVYKLFYFINCQLKPEIYCAWSCEAIVSIGNLRLLSKNHCVRFAQLHLMTLLQLTSTLLQRIDWFVGLI